MLSRPEFALCNAGANLGFASGSRHSSDFEFINTDQLKHFQCKVGVRCLQICRTWRYGSGVSEEQLGIALKKNRSLYTVATKFGLTYNDGSKEGLGNGGVNGQPEYLRQAFKKTQERLQTDTIDL